MAKQKPQHMKQFPASQHTRPKKKSQNKNPGTYRSITKPPKMSIGILSRKIVGNDEGKDKQNWTKSVFKTRSANIPKNSIWNTFEPSEDGAIHLVQFLAIHLLQFLD